MKLRSMKALASDEMANPVNDNNTQAQTHSNHEKHSNHERLNTPVRVKMKERKSRLEQMLHTSGSIALAQTKLDTTTDPTTSRRPPHLLPNPTAKNGSKGVLSSNLLPVRKPLLRSEPVPATRTVAVTPPDVNKHFSNGVNIMLIDDDTPVARISGVNEDIKARKNTERSKPVEITIIDDDNDPPLSRSGKPDRVAVSSKVKKQPSAACDVIVIDDHRKYTTRKRKVSGEVGTISRQPKIKRTRTEPRSVRTTRKLDGPQTEGDREEVTLIKGSDKRKVTMPIPNVLITRDGSTTAFRHELVGGSVLDFSHWDLHNMSISKLLGDVGLTFSVDMMLRERGLRREDGVVWLHETLLLEKLFDSKEEAVGGRKRGGKSDSAKPEPDLTNFQLRLPRWHQILRSKLLMAPIFQGKHWSLLVVANCEKMLDKILSMSPTAPPCSIKGPVQLLGVHFDSLSSSGHCRITKNILALLEKGLLQLWGNENKNEPDVSPPNVHAILERCVKISSAKVDQQTDGVSCGWRTLLNAKSVTTSRITSDPNLLKEFVTNGVTGDHQDLALRYIEQAMQQATPSSTDVPSFLFPLHAIVDEEVLSYFEATPPTLSTQMRHMIFEGKSENLDKGNKRSNEVKKAQWKAVKCVSDRVVTRMKNMGLNKRKVMRRGRPVPDSMCLEVAKFLFHYPRGRCYAESLYYTRYNYPDSFLVCGGLDLLFSAKPQLFGETISSQSSRVSKSNSVHYQMSMLRDPARGKTRYFHETARFRLQLLEIHFKGIAEAIVKSCCKFARDRDQRTMKDGVTKSNSAALDDVSKCNDADDVKGKSSKTDDTKKTGRIEPQSESESDEEVHCSGDGRKNIINLEHEATKGPTSRVENEKWCFENSISVEPSTETEVGKMRSNVSFRDIAGEVDACLTLADSIANTSIMNKIEEFHLICKRNLQMKDRTLKITQVGIRVTAGDIATIPAVFSKEFSCLLKEAIKNNWSGDLPVGFFEGSLDDMIQRLLQGANNFFRRNGTLFFNISPHSGHLNEDIFAEKRSEEESKVVSLMETRVSKAGIVPDSAQGIFGRGSAVPDSFGLVLRTLHRSVEPLSKRKNEFITLLFHLLRNCRPHQRCEAFECCPLNERKSEDEDKICSQKLRVVREELFKSLKALKRYVTSLSSQHNHRTLHARLSELKFGILEAIATKIAGMKGSTSRDKLPTVTSDIYCYELPSPASESAGNKVGGKFLVYHSGGQQCEKAIWYYSVFAINCEPLGEDKVTILESGRDSFISDFVVPTEQLPKLLEVEADVEVRCSLDLWNETDYDVTGDSYLGFRRFDLVRLVFSFQREDKSVVEDDQDDEDLFGDQENSDNDDSSFDEDRSVGEDPSVDEDPSSNQGSPNPLTSVYAHSMLGIVIDDPIPDSDSVPQKSGVDGNDMRIDCVGPRRCKVRFIVQDDVADSSGHAVSLHEVLRRWSRSFAGGSDQDQAACLLLPVEGISFRDRLQDYVTIDTAAKLPKSFQLSLLDVGLSQSYTLEQRLIYYDVVSFHCQGSHVHRLPLQPLEAIESDWENQIEAVVKKVDAYLNAEQMSVINKALYGWRTKLKYRYEAGDEDPITHCSDPMFREFMISNEIALKSDLVWWGCNLSFLQGLPGTGKTRTVSALIATILLHMEGYPRVMVVSKTRGVAHDLFNRVVRLVREASDGKNDGKKDILDKVIQLVGPSTHSIVGKTNMRRSAEDGSVRNSVDDARCVFATLDSLRGIEVQNSRKPFSMVIIEETTNFRQEQVITAVCGALVRESEEGKMVEYFRKASILCVGDTPLHEEQEMENNFFVDVWKKIAECKLSVGTTLSKQYRMSIPIVTFLNRQYYYGSMTTPSGAAMTWKEDNKFNSLKKDKFIPVCNVMVVDTSLEEALAGETACHPKSFYNSYEAQIIGHLMKTWTKSMDEDWFQKRVTVMSPYIRQRDEISRELAKIKLPKVQARTIDEIIGLENDIIIISLVRTDSSDCENDAADNINLLTDGSFSDEKWINVALSRARQAVVVVGHIRHISRKSSNWASFFQHCLDNMGKSEKGTYGYFRPRRLESRKDKRLYLSAYSPGYVSKSERRDAEEE